VVAHCQRLQGTLDIDSGISTARMTFFDSAL
jgi:hypothetical protein